MPQIVYLYRSNLYYCFGPMELSYDYIVTVVTENRWY